MDRKGILLVVSGFSGAGKGTLMKELVGRYDNYALSISATTRSPREGELDGREYFFRTKEEFEQMIADDALIEHACYVGNYYGTPRAYVEEQLALGRDVILEIEIQGALQIKKRFPDTLLLFVSTPDEETLKNRLIGRGTESLDVVEKRLSRASEEAEGIENYDYFIINDDLDTCVTQVHQIIQGEHSRVSRNLELINTIKKDISKFQKG